MHRLLQRDCRACDKLWKIYWWGGHHDEALIRLLEMHPSLLQLPDELPGTRVTPGRGFLKGSEKFPSGWLADFKELPVESLHTYGPQSLDTLVDVPTHVERMGQREVFEGSRLLLRRGVPAGGKLTIRHETRPYCFRHSVLGFRLEGFEEWQEKIILGVYWSSLSRYYLFMTLGSWGMWHDELQLETSRGLPIVLPTSRELQKRITSVVTELQNLAVPPRAGELFEGPTQRRVPALERQLDDAVFDLYGLDDPQRDLIREMCSLGLDLLYQGDESAAVKSVGALPRSWGTYADVARANSGLGAYLQTFLRAWNSELEPDGELAWRILSPPSGAPLVAVHFTTRFKNEPVTAPSDTDAQAWANVLEKLDRDTRVPVGKSAVFVNTFFRLVSTKSREMLFVKRNEARFWTRTAAREDAEAALVQLSHEEKSWTRRSHE